MKEVEKKFRDDFQELLEKYNAEFELDNYWQSKALIIIPVGDKKCDTIKFDLSE